MEIAPGIIIRGMGLAIGDNLIISDLHVGAEESLNKQGYLIPRFQFLEMRDELLRLIEKKEFNTVIINGDLKHEFGTISESEWKNTLKILELISHYCKKTILIKGNHDTILGPIAYRTAVEVKDYHMIGDILVCHGDKIPYGPAINNSKKIIIGHEHPAISLRRSGRVESFKCFLKGSYRDKGLIVIPSFSNLSAGSNVLKEKTLSPFLEQGVDKFEVFAVGDKTYAFGKVATLRSLC